MKRLSLLLLFVGCCWAQNPGGGGGLRNVTTLPSTCTVTGSNVVFKTTATIGPYYCNPANNWNSLTGGMVNPGFGTLTTGTNTTAVMTVGSGAQLLFTGTGIINASKINGTTFPAVGTTGGMPWWSAGNIILSTAILNTSIVMVGGGIAGAPHTITSPGSPGQVLTSNGAALDPSFQAIPAVTGFANTALSNLAATAVNASIVPGGGGVNLGGFGTPWATVYVGGSNFGTAHIALTGFPTDFRTANFPDASFTVAGLEITNAFTGRQDSTGAASTAPAKTGTSLPGTCSVGDLYFKSDAAAGQNIYECQSTNTWTQENSGGANTTLSNLGTTNINSSFLFQSAKDVGSFNSAPRNLYFGQNGGGNAFKLDGVPTAGQTVTFPNASFTVAGLETPNIFTGRQDSTAATSTAPMKTGTSVPGTCAVGDLFFKSNATAGQNIYQCQSTNVFTQQLNSGGGGGGSVFTGSTATNPSFSATPTFSLADVSVKSPLRIEPGALTGNISSVVFTNKTAGAKFSIAWLQDGTGGRTVTYGASVAGTPACSINPTLNITTTQLFEVGADGSTVNGTGCRDNSNDALRGPEEAAPGTPPANTAVCWFDSTNHVLSCKDNNSATISNVVVPSTCTNQVFSANVAGVFTCSTLNVSNSVTGLLAAANGGTGLSTSASTGTPKIASGTWSVVATGAVRGLSFSAGDPTNSGALTTSSTTYVTVPFACTISAYNLLVDATDTTMRVKFWKIATGTAIPTVSQSISTSGLGVPSATAIHSTTVSDFTTTTVAQNDIMAMNVSVANTAKFVNAVLECDQ